eukprot:CAMPEP_0183834100 /NCGR_PEP_ID=MMETSP0807_2-20130328/6423_1 /TAXON_ID=88271 /ORGANISM="Picocystis salinarum, Strain CCMP1897" /LENGTH=76 /DNA_ID=CAMNT_0026080085 /DNA_START=281 /DNA_END=511 /DNA_ORIENTATION=-
MANDSPGVNCVVHTSKQGSGFAVPSSHTSSSSSGSGSEGGFPASKGVPAPPRSTADDEMRRKSAGMERTCVIAMSS